MYASLLTVYPAPFPIQVSTWHDGGMFMGMHWGWWSIWIVTLVVLFWAFFRVFADRSETRRRQRDRERAEDALRERFARGEIDDQEFEARMETLRRSRG